MTRIHSAMINNLLKRKHDLYSLGLRNYEPRLLTANSSQLTHQVLNLRNGNLKHLEWLYTGAYYRETGAIYRTTNSIYHQESLSEFAAYAHTECYQ